MVEKWHSVAIGVVFDTNHISHLPVGKTPSGEIIMMRPLAGMALERLSHDVYFLGVRINAQYGREDMSPSHWDHWRKTLKWVKTHLPTATINPSK